MNEKIMVVDDHDDIREVIHVLLTNEGYQIIEAKNGKEALELLDDSIDLRDYSLKNTVILPSIDYNNLKYYIPYFDYVFFPLLNDSNHIIYNKVLECSAMKKHIISFENKELLEFNLPNLILVKNTDELIKTISEKEVKDYNLSEEINKTLIKYKWENIISKVLPL